MTADSPSSDTPELPWPQKGDQLFKADDNDWWLNAAIDHWNKDLHSYAEGYKQAGDIIVEYLKANQQGVRAPLDYVIFPVVFLYRQYIELRLKEIILVGNKLYKDPQGLPRHHRIDELWKHARSILERDSAKKSDLDIVESCVGELAQIDPLSTAFRYPTDKEGNRSITLEQLLINVRRLQEVMTRLASFLDASSDYLLIQWQELKEIEDYYSP